MRDETELKAALHLQHFHRRPDLFFTIGIATGKKKPASSRFIAIKGSSLLVYESLQPLVVGRLILRGILVRFPGRPPVVIPSMRLA